MLDLFCPFDAAKLKCDYATAKRFFCSQTLVARISPSQHQSVKEKNFFQKKLATKPLALSQAYFVANLLDYGSNLLFST